MKKLKMMEKKKILSLSISTKVHFIVLFAIVMGCQGRKDSNCEYIETNESNVLKRLCKFGQKKIENYTFKDSLVIYEYTTSINENIMNYKFFNPLQELVYERVYNSNGDVISEQGSKFSHIRIMNDNLVVGDTLDLKIYHINTKSSRVRIFGVSDNGDLYKFPNLAKKNTLSFVKNISLPLKVTGSFHLQVAMVIEDEVTLKKDTIYEGINFKVGSVAY